MIVEPLQAIAQTAFPNRTIEPGFSRDEIAEAEARLKIAFPEALKDYLAMCGKIREMMDRDYRLYSPADGALEAFEKRSRLELDWL
ncbi:MAG TPA: SMI1/KNR4 family protein [Blastocatellia bacterium]